MIELLYMSLSSLGIIVVYKDSYHDFRDMILVKFVVLSKIYVFKTEAKLLLSWLLCKQ